MTTRKASRPGVLAAVAGMAAVFAGCATPGPMHVYSIAAPSGAEIHDRGPGSAASVSSFLEPGERISGLAYDPFTDHFFLRLEPGHRVRVVDRPARAIKREFEIGGASRAGGGDMAVRPRDGHIFLLHPGEPAILETSRFGDWRQTIRLAGAAAPPIGVAYDMAGNELLVLHADGRRVTRHASDGSERGSISLAQTAAHSLAYDPGAQELYAPLAGQSDRVGVFDRTGKLVRTEPAAGPFVDVGMRSFVRVF